MSWHVLHVRPRSEKKLAQHCEAYGIKHYLPLREETKVYQRRKVHVDKPVFPGYVFVSLDPGTKQKVLETQHVFRIITPEDESFFLHELAQIRTALTVDPSLGTCSALQSGRKVRIVGGPFMGVEGVISTMKKNATVRLNVEMIGRAVALEVDVDYLELVD